MTKTRAPRVTRLPEPLPPGETILWRGKPRAWPVAVRVFHVRPVAAYFVAMLVWRGVVAWNETASALATLVSLLWVLPLALAVLGILGLFAWLVKRTTTYTITSRRLVIQYGVAFPMTLNLPFKRIGSAAVKTYGDGTGDIPVSLVGKDKVAYLVLWPHARPWRVKRPEPMLRGIVDPMTVAGILSDALKRFLESEEASGTDGATAADSGAGATAPAAERTSSSASAEATTDGRGQPRAAGATA